MRELRDLPRDVRRHRWAPDVLLVGALVLWVLAAGAVAGVGLMVIGLLMVVPLLWRRREPLLTAVAVAAACLLQVAASNEPHPANVAVPIAVYSAAAFGTRRQSFAVLWLGLAGAVVAGVDWRWSDEPIRAQLFYIGTQAFFLSMFVAVAWVLGDVVRRRKAVVARLEQQNAALARDQAQRQQLTAQSERASIAREMHDIVAHSLAVVVVQADGALYAARQALDAPPAIGPDRAALQRAAQTLETLAGTARTSLADTRRLVGVLRDEGSSAELAPLQGLAYLDDLVQRVRDSGVTVHLAVRGRVDDLPKEVDLAAYRVVQEGLTNVLKHAGPHASVDVDLLRTPAMLLVRLTDDGSSPDGEDHRGDGAGNGLLGMTERVEVLDGSVHAGPRARGGWEVVASIPVEARGGSPSRGTTSPSSPIPSPSTRPMPSKETP